MKNVSELIDGQKVVPVVVIENEEQAHGLANAFLDGGVNVIEVTLRDAFGIDAIKIIKRAYPNMVVLAGTVKSVDQMHAVIEAGADGIVSPGITDGLLKTAKQANIPYLPGVGTATDIMHAIEYGLSECKLFPATVVGGISALKAFSGPFGEIRFCPTGGVNAANYQDFLALDNVMFVGGSWLAPSDLVAAGDWQAITEICKAIN